jgi:hypothetical protein
MKQISDLWFIYHTLEHIYYIKKPNIHTISYSYNIIYDDINIVSQYTTI